MVQIAALQMSDANNSDPSWTRSLSIGSLVRGEIQEIKEFGVVVSFIDHGDAVGFVTHHQGKLFIYLYFVYFALKPFT